MGINSNSVFSSSNWSYLSVLTQLSKRSATMKLTYLIIGLFFVCLATAVTSHAGASSGRAAASLTQQVHHRQNVADQFKEAPEDEDEDEGPADDEMAEEPEAEQEGESGGKTALEALEHSVKRSESQDKREASIDESAEDEELDEEE